MERERESEDSLKLCLYISHKLLPNKKENVKKTGVGVGGVRLNS